MPSCGGKAVEGTFGWIMNGRRVVSSVARTGAFICRATGDEYKDPGAKCRPTAFLSVTPALDAVKLWYCTTNGRCCRSLSVERISFQSTHETLATKRSCKGVEYE